MKVGDIYKTNNEGRESLSTYIRVLEIFKPGTYKYNCEKEKLGSEGKKIKGIFIKYERSDNLKFDFCFINYMTRKDFLSHFNKFNY